MSVLPHPQPASRWLGGWRRPAAGLLLLALVLAAQAGLASGHAVSASRSGVGSGDPSHGVPTLPGVFQCSDDNPCQYDAGTYLLSLGEVLPGLQLTLPADWSSTENWVGELKLVAPGHADDLLRFWVDMVAVKSSGDGHGTVLNDVGTSPRDLTRWLTTNPDFHIVTGPRATTIGDRIPVLTLSLNVSKTADYGDPGCPPNPRCADLFTRPDLWGPNVYGIGGDEEIRLYIGTIRISGV